MIRELLGARIDGHGTFTGKASALRRDARVRIALALAVIAASAGGWAALGQATEGGPGLEVIEIVMRDGEIEVDRGPHPAGEVMIEVTNDGTGEHEPAMVRTELAAGELPVGLHGVSLERAGEVVLGEDHAALGHDHGPDEVLGLLPGEAITYRVELEPGRYVVLCNTDGHYLAGERAELVVER